MLIVVEIFVENIFEPKFGMLYEEQIIHKFEIFWHFIVQMPI